VTSAITLGIRQVSYSLDGFVATLSSGTLSNVGAATDSDTRWAKKDLHRLERNSGRHGSLRLGGK
jgi:hypothetical protein